MSGVIRHPEYNPSTFENDIAILKLSEPAIDRDSNEDFDFSKTSPICLPHKNTCFSPDTPCVVTGWGISDTDMWYREDYLQEVGVRIMNNAECQQHPTMKYLFLLIFLFAIAVIGSFLAQREETPTENTDNVNIRVERLKVA